MQTIKKNLEIEMPISQEELAKLFCEMHNDEQAMFFNEIARQVKIWDKPFVFQVQSIINSGLLTDEAKNIMKEIGQYYK